MAGIPSGYTPLAKIGISDKGEYVSGTTYEKQDSVLYKGSTYVALIDNPVGEPTNDGVNWRYLAKGFPDDINEVEFTFTEAESRENIETGEKSKTIFGKIRKWFAEQTAAAFAQIISSYADMMSNTVDGYLLDALAVKEGFETVNSNLSTKAEKRQYVTSVVGTEKITLDTSAYKVECMVIPYPDAGTKTAVPITIDLGILSYTVGSGTYNVSYGGNSDYHFELTVTMTAYTKNISLKSVKWSNTDVTSTAKLVVATVS